MLNLPDLFKFIRIYAGYRNKAYFQAVTVHLST